jgi:hypothetical protein
MSQERPNNFKLEYNVYIEHVGMQMRGRHNFFADDHRAAHLYVSGYMEDLNDRSHKVSYTDPILNKLSI